MNILEMLTFVNTHFFNLIHIPQ